MSTATETRNVRSIQYWPSGRSVHYSGDCQSSYRIHEDFSDKEGRKPTAEESRELHVQVLATVYAERDVLCCDSCLVEDLMPGHEGTLEGFGYDDMENVYVDPDEWTLEQCREWLEEHGVDLPPTDPAEMDREELAGLLESVGIEVYDDETDETLREAVTANIDDETLDGIDEWREAVRDNATEYPAEVYEWWRVSSWLCSRLRAIGEVVIDNGYGHWWGRTCTGQGMLMDGTLQEVARYNMGEVDRIMDEL